jgi:hypothetical protein
VPADDPAWDHHGRGGGWPARAGRPCRCPPPPAHQHRPPAGGARARPPAPGRRLEPARIHPAAGEVLDHRHRLLPGCRPPGQDGQGHRRPAEAAKYARLRDRIRKAFIERFFDPRTDTFATPTPAGYRQTSNAVPLAFGLVPEDRREAVAAKPAANVRGLSRGHLNTGMFGFETFTVRPGLFGDLKEVRASTETVRGRITVHWRMGPGGACSSTGPCRGTAQRRSIWRRGRSPPSPRAGTPSAEPRAFVSSGPRTARPSCRSAPAATGSMSQDGGRPAPASVAGGGPRRSCRGSARCHRRWGRTPGCRGAAGRGRPGGRSA